MKYCNILCRNTCRGSKLHLNFMPFKYSSIYCKAQRERERDGGEVGELLGPPGRERGAHTNEHYMQVCLDTQGRTSLCTNGALYKRDPPTSLLSNSPTIPIHTRTYMHVHFSQQNTHLHHHDLSALDCLRGRWGEGIDTKQRRQTFLHYRASQWLFCFSIICLSFFWGGRASGSVQSPLSSKWCQQLLVWKRD